MRLRTAHRLLAVLCLLSPLALGQVAEDTHIGSTSAQGDSFGRSVALDGDLMVVGALFHDGAEADTGAAYVFERIGGVWSEVQELSDPELDASDRFGISVAIDGERIVVGANVDENSNDDRVGAAYVFDRINGTWVRTARLTDDSIDFIAEIGFSVAVHGDLVAVGSTGSRGAVYLWNVAPGGGAVLIQKIEDSNAPGTDDFGYSVALDGNTLLVGSTQNDSFGGNAGAAYFYNLAGTATLVAKVGASGNAPQSDFGWSVDVDGDVAVIGAGAENGPLGSDSGAAYVWRRTGGIWSEQQRLEAPDGKSGELFGRAVTVSGDRLLVGAERGDGDRGKVYLFAETANGWRSASTFTSTDGSGDGRFGGSVSMDGDGILIGSSRDDYAGSTSGGAHTYDLGSLHGGPATIDLFYGGTQFLTVEAGAARAGQLYVVLGSRSGTAPGLALDGLILPLNPDGYLLKTFDSPNTPPLSGSLGTLDAAGRGFATFSLPPVSSPALAGITAHHAALTLDLVALVVDFTTNAVALELLQ